MDDSQQQPSDMAITEDAEPELAEMTTLELYRMLTRIDGMDFGNSEQLSRDQLLGIVDVLFNHATPQAKVKDTLINAVLKVFLTANSVLRSIIIQDGDSSSAQNNAGLVVKIKPYEQALLWDLVQKRLASTSRGPPISYNSVRLAVNFYSAGFHRLITSGTLQLPKSDKRRLLLFAVVEWHMLNEEYQCNIQLLPQDTALSNKRPRLIEYSDSSQNEDSSTGDTASTSASTTEEFLRVGHHGISSGSGAIPLITDTQHHQKVRVLTAHLEQLWERTLERSRASQKWLMFTLNALLDAGGFTIQSSFLKTSLLEYASKNETQSPVTGAARLAEQIAKDIAWDDLSAEEESDFVLESSSGSGSGGSDGEESEGSSDVLMSLDGE